MGAEGHSLSAPHHHNHILTPRTPSSAVSSFNLPAQYDSTLFTPTNPSPLDAMKATEHPHKSNDIRLSPIVYSPTYVGAEEDDYSYRPREMKYHKDYHMNGGLNISTNDDGFPASPMICHSPYVGSFGASVIPQSAGGSYSSSSVQQSPQLVSAGGMSNGSGNSGARTPALTPSSYRPLASHTPQLIAPNPATYRSSSNRASPPYGRSSLGSIHSPHRRGSNSFSSASGSNSHRVKKPKKKSSNEHIFPALLGQNLLSEQDHFVIHGRVVEGLSWNELTARYNKKFDTTMQKAALEMRKNRIGVRYKNHISQSQQASHGERVHDNRDRYGSEDSYEEYHEYVVNAAGFEEPFQLSYIECDSRSWSDVSSPSLPDEESAKLYSALSPMITLQPLRIAPNNHGHPSYQSPRLSEHDRAIYSPPQDQHNDWQRHQVSRR